MRPKGQGQPTLAIIKYCSMDNPFSPGDKVLIMRKGDEIEATVRATWKHEVQVRVADGELLWRTVSTVRALLPPNYPVPGGSAGETPEIMAEGRHELYCFQRSPEEETPAEPASSGPEEVLPVEDSPEAPVIDEPAEQAAAPDTESEQPGKRSKKSKKERKSLLRRILPKGPFMF